MSRVHTAVLSILCITVYYGCSNREELSVEPVSKEYNDQFLTGKGLDARFFSTKDVVQYYQVSRFNTLPPKVVLAKLNAFVNARYETSMRDSVSTLNVLFYKKRWFADYDKLVYEAARENENRSLDGHSDDLVAWITYQKVKGDNDKLILGRFFFLNHASRKPLEERDTVDLK
jgi:hypothetical protein